jgi:ferredoxin
VLAAGLIRYDPIHTHCQTRIFILGNDHAQTLLHSMVANGWSAEVLCVGKGDCAAHVTVTFML